jgi:hypothetical protein
MFIETYNLIENHRKKTDNRILQYKVHFYEIGKKWVIFKEDMIKLKVLISDWRERDNYYYIDIET